MAIKISALLLAVLLLLLIVSVGSGSASSNLIAHWTLDNTAEDATIGANHGTLVNGAGYTTGQIGQALALDGVDDYATTGYAPNLTMSDSLSVAVWFKTTSVNSGWLTGAVNSPYTGYLTMAAIHPSCAVGQLIWEMGDNTSTNINICTNNIFNDGGWHLAVGVLDRTLQTMTIYVDGMVEGSAPTTALAPLDFTGEPFFIGAYNNHGSAAGNTFDGAIDDVRVYDRALSASEVGELYDGGVVGGL
jgi:hypothetical protein